LHRVRKKMATRTGNVRALPSVTRTMMQNSSASVWMYAEHA
jgi:hypothetical protein